MKGHPFMVKECAIAQGYVRAAREVAAVALRRIGQQHLNRATMDLHNKWLDIYVELKALEERMHV